MARQVTTVLVDDINGSETNVETVRFALDGTAYEIDLSEKNARALRQSLNVYINRGRKAPRERVAK